ncbi:hypothetical protein [Synechococcus sp. CS-1332]|uniref:hypothetical protein n=1 Tax=Synechococcus sp. CS-1332 TaxID=2847972 RepID=UPI00223B54F6|nr:hypothetical protein [Synechococcus sp. CS-1332]MCT0206926.1 hypothetical protein [Synechococcus sp. CS-1332]
MAAPATALQEWLLRHAPDGSPATLPSNILRAFDADDLSLLPVFVAHAWQEHLRSEVSRGLREASDAEQQRLEAVFHAQIGLGDEHDGDLALQLGRAVDRRLVACHRFLHLTAQPMPDGRRWFRLEISHSPVAPGGLPETVQMSAVESESQARAICESIHEVLATRGFQASAEQGLFHLEGPQLGALVAILKRLALPESEALMALAA